MNEGVTERVPPLSTLPLIFKDVDTESSMDDSGIDTDYTTDMESVTSSAYATRHGTRRYHGIPNNPYPLPNDELEKDRLDALQTCFELLLGTDIVAPIGQNPTQIIDVGTGSGKWVINVADEYPTARVIGIDLSPIQPTYVPINAQFILMDLTGGLQFDGGSTDLVQSRIIHAGVTESNWPPFMKEVYRILKHGVGWAQCIEFGYPYCLSENDSLPRDAPLSKLFEYIHDHFRASMGILMDGGKLEQLMIDAGFIDVTVKKIRIEVGDWGQNPELHKLGRIVIDVWAGAFEALAEKLETQFPDDEERGAFGEAVTRDLANPAYRLYTWVYVATGRKPPIHT